MFCFFRWHKKLENELSNSQKEEKELLLKVFDLKVENEALKAKNGYLQLTLDKQESALVQLNECNKQYLEDLLIASGVKLSKYQEKLMEKQLNDETEQKEYVSQGSRWDYNMTAEGLQEAWKAKQASALKISEELEKELLI